jgi:hypothetical protein
MKLSFSCCPFLLSSTTFLLFLWAGFLSRAQETVPFLLKTGTELEMVGFPLQHPAYDSGMVATVTGSVVSWSPSFLDRPFGTALNVGEECYAEVVGPANHPWLGHRFELDETATRARTDHALVAENSGLNTRGLPRTDLAGATLEVRPHLTIPFCAQNTIARRVIYGGEKSVTFQFYFPSSIGEPLWAVPVVGSGGVTGWLDQTIMRPLPASQLLIPPGSSVGVKFGQKSGLAVGLTGNRQKTPVAKPLSSGFNFVSYPYPQDMRLGLDWGGPSSGFRGATSPRGADRIEICVGLRRLVYSPESSLGSGNLRWRMVNPARRHEWKQPAEYLDQIPVGHGFLVWKNQPDSNHFFYPPKP